MGIVKGTLVEDLADSLTEELVSLCLKGKPGDPDFEYPTGSSLGPGNSRDAKPRWGVTEIRGIYGDPLYRADSSKTDPSDINTSSPYVGQKSLWLAYRNWDLIRRLRDYHATFTSGDLKILLAILERIPVSSHKVMEEIRRDVHSLPFFALDILDWRVEYRKPNGSSLNQASRHRNMLAAFRRLLLRKIAILEASESEPTKDSPPVPPSSCDPETPSSSPGEAS